MGVKGLNILIFQVLLEARPWYPQFDATILFCFESRAHSRVNWASGKAFCVMSSRGMYKQKWTLCRLIDSLSPQPLVQCVIFCGLILWKITAMRKTASITVTTQSEGVHTSTGNLFCFNKWVEDPFNWRACSNFFCLFNHDLQLLHAQVPSKIIKWGLMEVLS